MRSKTTIFLPITLAVLCLTLAGCGDKPKAQSQKNVPLVEVGVVTVSPQTVILTTELSGRTNPYLIAEVRPQVGGIIQKRLFREGSEIKAGQLLYQIDPAMYQAAYDSAKATLARDEAVLTAAQLKFGRYKKLVAIKAVSQEAYDDADAALKRLRAVLEMDKAVFKMARINLAYTRVKSPINGRVGRSTVTQGALVTGDQAQALATVRQLDPIYVDVTQSSVQLLQLKHQLQNGQLERLAEIEAKVGLILEDGSTYPHHGRLQFSEVTVDEQTGTVTLRAVFPNPENELLPGMYVRAVVQKGVRNEAILAPQQGVSRDSKGNASALVLTPEGKVERRKLQLDCALEDKWLVNNGLQAGDVIIVEGLQKVRPGSFARGVSLDKDQEKGTLAQTKAVKDEV